MGSDQRVDPAGRPDQGVPRLKAERAERGGKQTGNINEHDPERWLGHLEGKSDDHRQDDVDHDVRAAAVQEEVGEETPDLPEQGRF